MCTVGLDFFSCNCSHACIHARTYSQEKRFLKAVRKTAGPRCHKGAEGCQSDSMQLHRIHLHKLTLAVRACLQPKLLENEPQREILDKGREIRPRKQYERIKTRKQKYTMSRQQNPTNLGKPRNAEALQQKYRMPLAHQRTDIWFPS